MLCVYLVVGLQVTAIMRGRSRNDRRAHDQTRKKMTKLERTLFWRKHDCRHIHELVLNRGRSRHGITAVTHARNC